MEIKWYRIFRKYSHKNQVPYCLNCRFYKRCYKEEFGEDY